MTKPQSTFLHHPTVRQIGEQFRVERKKRQMNRAAFAALLGFKSDESYAKMEQGRRGISLPMFAHACEQLGWSMDTAYFGPASPEP